MDSCNLNYLKEEECSDRIQDSEKDKIRRIKQMLISGNKEQIICAACEILSGMEDNRRMTDMIKSDICEFLCNSMVPFESHISGTIYNCLAIMTKSEYFYSHGHTSVAIETVTQSMHFLIKRGPDDFTLSQPLKLLELIVQGHAEFHVQPEEKPLKNLIALISSLLKETLTQGIKYQIGVIIKGMFNMEFLINKKWLINISEKWLDASFIKTNERFSLSEDFINLGCVISKESLSCLTNNNVTEHESGLETGSDSNIANTITIFLLEYASQYVMVNGDQVGKEGIEKLEHYFTCLGYLLKDLFEQQELIIHKLSEMGFIQLIFTILSNKYLNLCEGLGKLCSAVLLEMLLALSDDVFNFTCMWPNGRDNFRNEMTKGMHMLPEDASLWKNSIADPALNRSGKLALIIFFYFHSLTIKSPSNEFVIMYPPAINLVNTMLEKTCSPLQIKAVWFIFATSQMSDTWIRNDLALEKMLDILEAQTELTLLYTHHPAMLYWAFSTPGISCRIQCEMITIKGEIVLMVIGHETFRAEIRTYLALHHAYILASQRLRQLRNRQIFFYNLSRPSENTQEIGHRRKSPLGVRFFKFRVRERRFYEVTEFGVIRFELTLISGHLGTLQMALLSYSLSGDNIFLCNMYYLEVFYASSIRLWLQNGSGDSGILDNLVEKSKDVRLALFKLLHNSDEYTMRMAFSALKTFMLSSEDDSLSSGVWFLLLQMLAEYTADTSNVSAVEVDYILELATLKAPQQQHLSESIRIASLLPEALNKTDLISLTTAVKLVLQLVEMSVENDDSRVLSAFLRSGAFIQRIVSALETNVIELLLYSLKIIIILWSKPPNSMLLPPGYNGITLDPSVLLKMINSKEMEIINTCLVLVEKMLSDRFKSHLIRVQVSSDFMKILFFDLENALMMYLPMISGRAWLCLKDCIREDDSLAEDVLLHEVIKYGLEHAKETPEIVDFLSFWIEKRREMEIFYSGYRRVKQSYFLGTIYHIGRSLAESPLGLHAGRLCDDVLKCCRRFSIDTSIEPFNRISSPSSDFNQLI